MKSLTDSEIRSLCKNKIESLEHWLRRLIDDMLTPAYGDYFTFKDAAGNRIIRSSLVKQVRDRRTSEPLRYPRDIDAVLLDDAIGIICNPQLFERHFQSALFGAFPHGNEEARTFLSRLLVSRNNLAHANAISERQAEQVICYSNDVIDSLKAFYRNQGMQQTYDVPLILRVMDSYGNTFTRSQFKQIHDGGIMLNFTDKPHMFLRPGDTLSLEVEVDPAFEPDAYTIAWSSTKIWATASELLRNKAVIPIGNKQVGQLFDVQCRVTSTKDWHRMQMGCDDFLMMNYKVLPPLT